MIKQVPVWIQKIHDTLINLVFEKIIQQIFAFLHD